MCMHTTQSARNVFARGHTFGKAVGYRGAIIVGSETLREYLINFARPFIYSTAPDLITVRYMDAAYRLMSNAHEERAALQALVNGMKELQREFSTLEFLASDTPIQGVIIPTNEAVLTAEARLQDAGFFAKAIRSPTVPLGSERIRLCLHSFNTLDEIRESLAIISDTTSVKVVHG